MALDLPPLINAIASHGLASGNYERVNGHEPKNPPGNGLTAGVWLTRIGPVPRGSGLAQTSARVEFTFRIYGNMLQEPQDDIDPRLGGAAGDMIGALSGDFTLGGLARLVDLLGQAGAPLGGQAGYLNMGGSLYRVFDLSVPTVINDVWEQIP